jgi:hypothetical protein
LARAISSGCFMAAHGCHGCSLKEQISQYSGVPPATRHGRSRSRSAKVLFFSSARNLSSLNRFVNQMQFAPRLQINRSAGRPDIVPIPPPVQDTGPLGLHQPATPRIELQPRTALAPLTLETVLGGAGLASCQCSKQNGPPSRCGSTAQACRRSIVAAA